MSNGGESMTNNEKRSGGYLLVTVVGGVDRTPDSLADMNESVIVNPEAVGNPDKTPVLFVGADLRAWLNPCACGGVNGFHDEACEVKR